MFQDRSHLKDQVCIRNEKTKVKNDRRNKPDIEVKEDEKRY